MFQINEPHWLNRVLCLVLLCTIGLYFSSCGPDDLYVEKTKIEEGTWSYDTVLRYDFDVQDTSLLYNLYLLADYASDYKAQNLYLKIQTRFPNGKETEVVRSFDFFDAQGNRLGDCSGSTCSLRAFLQENAYFNLQGTYSIHIYQHSRQKDLSGIQAIGIEVERGAKRQGVQ